MFGLRLLCAIRSSPVCDLDALSKFVEYLSTIVRQPLTDQELQKLASGLDLSALEDPVEQHSDSARLPTKKVAECVPTVKG
jgi:hypothetical protein